MTLAMKAWTRPNPGQFDRPVRPRPEHVSAKTLGHEPLGVIEQVGSAVEVVKPGAGW